MNTPSYADQLHCMKLRIKTFGLLSGNTAYNEMPICDILQACAAAILAAKPPPF
jgi:hypothetical protein